ncbi:hypothetical protein [Actinomadura sp. NEAU-AAG7]|uniref:hypothetical protein n=1 Tax=Actinomadura sp. NEAU-AAG7 TaxID=2839640 RepID=UPI001BE43228|nr:hypothetical protein [Actinomadura sp. NEAU-AAG7]MBT2212058.1 hypothetical protein [Actinomadura sp. NEAU-AAG7]
MVRLARAALFIVVPAEAVALILPASGVRPPESVVAVAEAAVSVLFVVEAAVAVRLWRAHRRTGLSRRAALRTAYEELVPLKVRRIIGFDTKGMVSLALFAARREHGVPDGAKAVSYHREQNMLMLMFMFAMVVEAVACEFLLRGVGAPAPLRNAVLAVDLYGILIGLAIAASGVTRPHVISEDEVRVRWGGFVDLRIPRDLIISAHRVRNFNEDKHFLLHDGTFALATGSQTNIVIQLSEPISVTRPLGGRDRARTIRFFADEPDEALHALTAVRAAVR